MSSQGAYSTKAPVVDSVLETLSNTVRREAIRYFEDSVNGDAAHIAELATHISHRIPSKSHEQLKTELHHQHLPRLDEKNWLAYDQRQGNIRYYGNERAEYIIEEVQAIF
ncbi:hypothetical protein [Natronomonas gomsonensis]|uniref:DUF7344 domain-containing protein n=1 Tax=Natronomonas gomsonensis TaxID=1046043 RepID=UPI0015BF62E3|nr:hypothetical protein [Natronomonas gomsonensis]